jgi:hypothetical protein
MDITRLEHEEKIKVWDAVYPMLSLADDFTSKLADLCTDILSDDSYELWVGISEEEKLSAVCLTQAIDGYYFIHKLSSDNAQHDWNTLIGHVEERAKELGLDRVSILGRKGWSKVLKEYHTSKYLYTKRLTGGSHDGW